MNKKVIGVISCDDNDFTSQVKFIVVYDHYITHLSKKKIETNDTIYYSIISPLDICGISFDSVIFTQKAIFNPELIKIIETIRPCIVKKPTIKTIEDAFMEQKEKNFPYPKEMFEKIDEKTYHNGDPVNIGDYVYYGFVEGNPSMIDNKPERTLILIILNESHFHLYEFVESLGSSIPVVKLKN